MLSNIIDFDNLIILLITVAITVFSIVLHELSHAFAAYLCGDDTAKIYGRLTLNPIKHIDVVGALCLILFRFGWAKPVPVNYRNFKNYKKDIVLVSIAGPLSNFILAFITTFIFYASFRYSFASKILTDILLNIISLNLGLALFNLIPIPPLDGSKILGVFLKGGVAYKYFSFERYTALLLFAMFMIPKIGHIFSTLLLSCVNKIYFLYIKLIELLFGVF